MKTNNDGHIEMPPVMDRLVRLIEGKSFEVAKRAIVSQVGSIEPREKIADDLADAVFLRLQQNAQAGRYQSEQDLAGRKPVRLEGEGTLTVYRCAPPGATLRPGDFVASTAHEAGYYKHGWNKVQAFTVPRQDLVRVKGSLGDAQELVLLPKGHVPLVPVDHFPTFRAFFEAVKAGPDAQAKATEALAWLDQMPRKKAVLRA